MLERAIRSSLRDGETGPMKPRAVRPRAKNGLIIKDHAARKDEHEDEPQVQQQVVEDLLADRRLRLTFRNGPRLRWALFAGEVPVDGAEGHDQEHGTRDLRDNCC